MKKLSDAGIAIDHGNHKKNIFIESDFTDGDLKIAKDLGHNVEIIINDVKSFYLKRNLNAHDHDHHKHHTRNASCSSSDGTINYETPVNYDIKPGNDFGGFYTYSEMLQELDDMSNLYPNLITVRADIKDPADTSSPHKHETHEGRYLQWVKISDNPNTDEPSEPQILYTAIHHAREPASLQQTIFYMWYLLENYDTSDEIKTIVDNTELYFVPCINPDGYVYNETTDPNGGGNWRKNRRDGHGVDNNRNYSYITSEGNEVWNTTGTSNNQNDDTFAGTGPFSEAENRAIRYFTETHNFSIALNNHTYSNLLLYPFGYDYNKPTLEDDLFKLISGVLVEQNGYSNIISSELYPASGDSDDFMYDMLTTESGGTRNKIYAMTPEIGSSFWPAASSIEGICKSMMYHNITAAKLLHNYANVKDTAPSFIETTTFNADYTIQRIGLSNPGDFTVTVNPVSANIINVGTGNSHNSMNIGDIATDNIVITLDNAINNGDEIIYEFIVNNGLFQTTKTITKIYGSTSIIFDEVANDLTTNWINNGWGTTTEDYVSASSSITDSPSSNYDSMENSSITLATPIDLTNAIVAQLSFYAKWNIEDNYDYVQLEISSDNGNNWTPQCGKFTNNGVITQNDAQNEPVYDANQNTWVLEEINLSDYLGASILIQFKLISDGSVNHDGFYFDDLQIKTIQDNLSVSSVALDKMLIYPNPTNDILTINTRLEDYSISLYAIQGQLIHKDLKLSGDHSLSLEPFSKGLYLLRISSKDAQRTFKIIKE
ncbi:MAG: immune inhibitor A [Flavobacteriaceae bacterium]|nr:immune inhibitor A [Flavobacteriaceae bacterium]